MWAEATKPLQVPRQWMSTGFIVYVVYLLSILEEELLSHGGISVLLAATWRPLMLMPPSLRV
jgi:hypothetical protein